MTRSSYDVHHAWERTTITYTCARSSFSLHQTSPRQPYACRNLCVCMASGLPAHAGTSDVHTGLLHGCQVHLPETNSITNSVRVGLAFSRHCSVSSRRAASLLLMLSQCQAPDSFEYPRCQDQVSQNLRHEYSQVVQALVRVLYHGRNTIRHG